MANALLTRRATFSASHRLYAPEMSEQENWEVFGKCSSKNGHGHNYVVEVTVKGPIEARTGVVLNLVELKAALQEEIIDRFDHKHLNMDVAEFEHLNPTAENIARVIWHLLEPKLPAGLLYEVLLRETENNVAIFRGE